MLYVLADNWVVFSSCNVIYFRVIVCLMVACSSNVFFVLGVFFIICGGFDLILEMSCIPCVLSVREENWVLYKILRIFWILAILFVHRVEGGWV